jgi:O-antigen/teichoic acid export membrane protein
MSEDAYADSLGRIAVTQRVLRGGLAFAAASALQRAAPLLLLPLFTRILTPTEYGQVGILLTLTSVLTALGSLGLETAFFRSQSQDPPGSKAGDRYINTVGMFALTAPLLISAVTALALGAWLSDAFGIDPGAVWLASLAAAFNASAVIFPLAVLRAREELRTYLGLTSVQLVVNLALTVFLVGVLRWGVAGWMLASLLSAVVLLWRATSSLHHNWTPEFDSAPLKASLAFGLPLVPHAAAHWALAVSDRAIIGLLVSTAAAGVYYTAYLFVLPVSLAAIAIGQATQPLFARFNELDKRQAVAHAAGVQVALVLLAGATAALLGPPVALLVLPPEYRDSAALIPYLSVGASLFGLYLIPMSAITLIEGKTGRVWLATVIAAGVNIGLNLLLVPRFGMVAAAVDTVLGYGVLLVGVFLYHRHVAVHPLPIDTRTAFIGLITVGVALAAGVAFRPSAPITALVLGLVLLMATAAVLFATGPLRDVARSLPGASPIAGGRPWK